MIDVLAPVAAEVAAGICLGAGSSSWGGPPGGSSSPRSSLGATRFEQRDEARRYEDAASCGGGR